ncbi:MAG: PilZ domain-containing protein [Desulfobacula sp.]|nr:PilZ domain-containing protein [Desulfobacula sp.]
MKNKNKKVDEIEVTSRLLNIILDMPLKQQLDLLNTLDTSGNEGSRRHTRTHLKTPWVVLVDPEKEKVSCDYCIKDISRCGMFIETSRSFSVGQKITMKFQIPSSKSIFKIMGEIVRFQRNGIGVKFKRQLSRTQQRPSPLVVVA